MHNEFEQMTQDILSHPQFLKTQSLMHHGDGNTVYQHSVSTAQVAYMLCKRFGLSEELTRSTTRAALLHDFFGYDWHGDWFKQYLNQYSGWQRWKRMHAFIHGDIAAERAKEYFHLSERQLRAIRSHMFPVCFQVPSNVEAWILTTADKIVASREMATALGGYAKSFYQKLIPTTSQD